MLSFLSLTLFFPNDAAYLNELGRFSEFFCHNRYLLQLATQVQKGVESHIYMI